MSGTVRSTTRAHEVFSKEELLNMQIFEGSFDPAERKQSEAFLSRVFESVRADAVVEVRTFKRHMALCWMFMVIVIVLLLVL